MLAEALVLPFIIRAGFWLVGVPLTQARLRNWAGSREAAPEPVASGIIAHTRISQRVVKASLGIDGTCLVRSLTLWAMLKKRGVDVDLQVGVRKRDGKFEGHAWLEYQGKPINEDPGLIGTYAAYKEPLSFDPAFWPK